MKQGAFGTRSETRRHDWVDERSRALHQAIAQKIRLDATLMNIPLANLSRWLQRASGEVQSALQSWKTLIETKPLEELLNFLTEDSELANQLRQSSPFTGILTPRERDEIFARYEAL